MRIAFAASELTPLAQVGGLGDVSRWLPAKLAAGGDDVAVFLPRYGASEAAGADSEPVLEGIDLGLLGEVSVSRLRHNEPPTIYLVESEQWFGTGAVYLPGADEHLRFGCLSASVPAVAKQLGWIPDLWHLNDWHTALVPLHAAAGGLGEVPSVLTIHNLAFQGVFPASDLGVLGLGALADRFDPNDLRDGWINSLRNGIAAATIVTSVSPTYAREITTPQHGMALDGCLRAKGDRLVGILNGIGDEWDPSADPNLPTPYGPDSLDLKGESTRALRMRLGLQARESVPIAGVVSRLTEQKGFDLLRHALPPLLEGRRLQLAAIGTGEPAVEAMFAGFAERHPDDVAFVRNFDPALAHLIEAGSDIFLMPSRFEPSGLNQMYSMRYGTVPVVRRTGGLADTVSEWDPATGSGTGFLFDEFTADAFAAALERAMTARKDPASWRRLQLNGMSEDFSWDGRAAEYRKVYRRAIQLGGSGR